MTKPIKPKRPMTIVELCNVHNYLIKQSPPLSETAKSVIREIEEHLLTIIQKERNQPTQTETNPTQPKPIPTKLSDIGY